MHVSDCYLPRLGGIELHLRDLATHQSAAGHDVIVTTSTAPPAAPAPCPFEVRHVDRWSAEDLRRTAPDVVQIHLSVFSPFAWSTARQAIRAGLPTVVTVHSIWSDLAKGAPLVRAATGVQRWPVHWTAVSRAAANHVERVVGHPVEVIANAVDVDFWHHTPALAADPSLSGCLPLTVVSVMRLTSVKRTMPLARILSGVLARIDAHAVIVGDGPKRSALERYVRDHQLEDRITLTGTVERDQVRRYLAGAAVFLAPAQRESFGIAALEARAAGLPIVAHAESGVASFIRHGSEGLLGATDRALEDRVLELLEDEALRAAIAAHNRAVQPRLGWDVAQAAHQEAYATARALAGARSARPARFSRSMAAGL